MFAKKMHRVSALNKLALVIHLNIRCIKNNNCPRQRPKFQTHTGNISQDSIIEDFRAKPGGRIMSLEKAGNQPGRSLPDGTRASQDRKAHRVDAGSAMATTFPAAHSLTLTARAWIITVKIYLAFTCAWLSFIYFTGFDSLSPYNNALRLSAIIPILQKRRLKYSEILESSKCTRLKFIRAKHRSLSVAKS